MHDDFAGLIKVKQNAPKLLKAFFQKKGFFPVHKKEQFAMYDFFPSLKDSEKTNIKPKFIVTVGGGVCDVYQPAERKTNITRALLEIVYDYQFPVSILTKSDLVLRDLDLIEKINAESFASVNFTITLNDESAQKIFEPGASTTSERFAAIKKLRSKGIQSGVYFYPALPFIGDTEDNIQAIYHRAQEVGAQYVYCWGLTLKPGRNKDEFMATIKEHYPELFPKYHKLYANNNKYGHLDTEQFKDQGLVWH
jgi:DNA repair photolyase